MILIKTPESSTNDDNNGSDSSMSPIVYRPPSFDTTINAVLPESPTIMEHHKHNKENNVNTSDAIYEKNDANNDIDMKGIILSTPNLHPSSSSLSLSCEGDEIACISGTVLEHIESMFKKKDMMKANDILRAFDRPTIRGLLHLYEVIHDKRWTDRELGNALANEMNRQHIRCSSRIGHILGKSKKEFSTHSTSDSSISSTFMSSDDTASHHSSSPIFSSRTMSPILPIDSSPVTSSLNITHYLSTIAKLTPELPNAVDSNYNYSELAPFLHDGQREEEHFDNLVKEVFGETFPDQDEQNDRYEKNKIPVKESYSYLKTKEGGCHNQPSEQSSSRPSKKRGRPRKNEHEHPTEEMDSGAARTKTNNVANHSALTYVSKPIIDSVPIPKVTILNCQKKDYWLDNAESKKLKYMMLVITLHFFLAFRLSQ